MIKAFFFDLSTINRGRQPPPGLPEARRAEGGRARRRDDGRRHRLRLRQGGHRGGPQGREHRGRREGQGLLGRDRREGRGPRALHPGGRRRAPGPDHPDRPTPRTWPARTWSSRPSSRASAVKHQVFAEIEDVVAAGRGARLQHLDPAHHDCSPRASRGRRTSSGCTSSRRWTRCRCSRSSPATQTSDETLAKAFDLALQIRKTPIVVNDSRGFFTSRVIGTFLNEAIAMVGEGVAPAVHRAGRPAGRLPRRAAAAGRRAQPDAAAEDPAGDQGRPSRRPAGPALRAPRRLRHRRRDDRRSGRTGPLRRRRVLRLPGRQAHRPVAGAGRARTAAGTEIPFEDMKERMLFAEALETVKCFDEGVLRTVADANIGSILGIGFPAWTGGVAAVHQRLRRRRARLRRPGTRARRTLRRPVPAARLARRARRGRRLRRLTIPYAAGWPSRPQPPPSRVSSSSSVHFAPTFHGVYCTLDEEGEAGEEG